MSFRFVTYKHFSSFDDVLAFVMDLSQEAANKQEIAELIDTIDTIDTKQSVKKIASTQEPVDSLKNTADDIGQISESSSEEKLPVEQFFSSLLKLMQPLTPSIPVDQSSLPTQLGDIVQASVDPTGHLILLFQDDHVELKDLTEKNHDLMTEVMSDILPKFKSLTSSQKRKLENRINLISIVTKEIQKSSETLSASIFVK